MNDKTLLPCLFPKKIKYFDLPKYHFSLELNFSVHLVEQKNFHFYFHQHLNIFSKLFGLGPPFTPEGHFSMFQVFQSSLHVQTTERGKAVRS